jgi:alkylhydroperoxidase family enzyme
MGHSEMGLAVAGLKDEEITQRVRQLAAGDWSDFPPAERLAFQFAYKLSREPSAVSERDVQGLVATFGRHRAVDIIWRSAWYNYMTRVADAFQPPLERENVFELLRKDKEKDKEKGAPPK